jgi:hypothetical protein
MRPSKIITARRQRIGRENDRPGGWQDKCFR